MMMESKKWYTSKAVWGGIISLGAVAASLFNVQIDEQTQSEILKYITDIIAMVGALVAIYGRVKADKTIK